ncbi:MAG: RagB/SusD family nutrient uptake outer membrane protein [Mediterranea sp.]|jgi:hypothetical protein|nr:RagB/SusD family nutrient uptake outer membrane protein [Mediterranea sp.]
MKKHISLYLLSILALMLSSCNDSELNLYPESRLTDESFYKNETELQQAANDAYRQLSRIYNAGGIPDLYGELASDNVYIKAASGGNTWPEDINKHQPRPDNGKLEQAWAEAYNAIYIINNILHKLEKTTVIFGTKELKERLIAEAKTIRAIIYFNLVQAWGDVPFPLTVVSPKDSYNYLREKKDVIYTQLISDLTESKLNLPPSYTGKDVGRITKYAATAVLAKIYATQGNKTNAANELKEIIDSNLYSLDANRDGVIDVDDYGYLFRETVKNSKESILEAQYLAGENNVNSSHQTIYAPWDFAFHLPGSTITFRGDGLNTPSENLVAEYEANDPRKNLSLSTEFIEIQTSNPVNYPYTLKFYDPNYLYPGQNVEIIRYADILLLYSEVTGNVSYLNQVRARVGLPGFGEGGYPAEAYSTLELALEHERRVELAFEFHRFFDLVRTNRAQNVLNITADKLLFPIPQSVIDVNSAIRQNP